MNGLGSAIVFLLILFVVSVWVFEYGEIKNNTEFCWSVGMSVTTRNRCVDRNGIKVDIGLLKKEIEDEQD